MNIFFLKNIDNNERSILFHTANIVLYTPKFEHFGIVPLEAMYCGAWVLASKSGGPMESVLDGKTGNLLDNEEPEKWALKIKEMIDNEKNFDSKNAMNSDELKQVWNVLVETDADLWDDNRHDGYEDLQTTNVANIAALIDEANSNAAFALAHVQKALNDAQAAEQDYNNKKGKFEELLPEDFDVLPTNEENDEIEKQIAETIKRIKEGIAVCNAITAAIVDSTNKINKAIITISIDDDKYNITLGVGESEQVTASVNTGNVVWASSNKRIASITANNFTATITGVAPGVSKIVAMSEEDNSETIIIVVTVTDDSDDGSN
jgi:hypothetical protein